MTELGKAKEEILPALSSDIAPRLNLMTIEVSGTVCACTYDDFVPMDGHPLANLADASVFPYISFILPTPVRLVFFFFGFPA